MNFFSTSSSKYERETFILARECQLAVPGTIRSAASPNLRGEISTNIHSLNPQIILNLNLATLAETDNSSGTPYFLREKTDTEKQLRSLEQHLLSNPSFKQSFKTGFKNETLIYSIVKQIQSQDDGKPFCCQLSPFSFQFPYTPSSSDNAGSISDTSQLVPNQP